jgi:hypothetical protein
MRVAEGTRHTGKKRLLGMSAEAVPSTPSDEKTQSGKSIFLSFSTTCSTSAAP